MVGGPLPPSVNPACQVPPLITTLAPPPALSILAFPSVLFFPLSMSAWPVLCTLTSALIHQGYITREPPELRAIPLFLQFSLLYKGKEGILCSYVV